MTKPIELKIVKLESKNFASALPLDELDLLKGIHDDRACYFAWYNGKLLGIIYDLKIFEYAKD